MIQKIYCIKDVKSGFNSALMLFINNEVAIRYFKTVSSDENSLLFKCKEDFELWCLGEVNLKTGEIISSPEFIYSMIGE